MKKKLGKSDKLRLKSEFDQVRLEGRKLVGSSLLIVYAPAPDNLLRCGVICGRKYSLLAVRRNRVRRLCWESFRLLKEYIPTVRLILIPRRRMAIQKRQEVTREMAELLIKGGLITVDLVALLSKC